MPRAGSRRAATQSAAKTKRPVGAARPPARPAPKPTLEPPERKRSSGVLAVPELAPIVTKQPLLQIDPSEPTRPDEIMVGTWSAENLFDTEDDPLTEDDAYTPEGRFKYDETKLKAHLDGLANVIRSVNGGRGPDILALTEVENAAVGDRLRKEGLGDLGYKPIVLIDGPDLRGIDTAVLSRYPQIGKPALHPVTREDGHPYRGILEVNLKVKGRPLTVYVNHWYAMRIGMPEEKGLTRRLIAANVLKGLIDEKLKEDPGREIVVLGDFNADPGDQSIVGADGLGAARTVEDAKKQQSLYDTMDSIGDLQQEDPDVQLGTHFYNPAQKWSTFDHALVSPTLLDDTKGFVWVPGSTAVVKNEVTADADGVPRRFFQPDGTIIEGGASDHFPVVMRLRKVGEDGRAS